MIRRLSPVLALIAVAAVAAALLRPAAATLTLSDARAAPAGDGEARVFLTIANAGPPDRLIGAASPAAAEARLVSPEAPDGPPLPAGAVASLAEDGAHVRLTGLSGPMTEGRLIRGTLTCARAGRVAALARVGPPLRVGDAALVGLFGVGDICRVEEGEPAPRLTLAAELDGDGWRLRADAEDFTFAEYHLGMPHIPGVGHGHVYAGGMKLGRLYAPETRIGALPPGEHVLRVTLSTNDHRAYVVDDAPATAAVTVAQR
jgi:copper(I)-binding protein